MALRVLYVNPGRDLGGAERCLLVLVRELQRHGVDPSVVLFGDGPIVDKLKSHSVPFEMLKVPGAVRLASRYRSSGSFAALSLAAQALPVVLRLSAVIRRVNPDIVHTNGLKAHILGGLAGRLAGRPVIWHLRDFVPPGGQGKMLAVSARALPARILAVSEAVANDLRARAGIETPVAILHDPIDISNFPARLSGAAKRAELRLGASTPLVGMVAHLTPWKGHEVFLRMARVVSNSVPDVRFLIVGGLIYETEGHRGYEDKLMRLAADLGLTGRVTFLGTREDVPELLAAMDVVVHCPTSPEPFGLVAVEAMAARRPVVAAAAGGIRETVQDGSTGILVQPGDILGFATAVTRVLSDPGLRERLGAAARAHAEAHFEPGIHAQRVLAVYREVLEK